MILCYNEERRKLYHASSAPSKDVLFHTYEDKGYKESDNINVGETGFSFIIKSNFGYGSASYLQFVASFGPSKLFDFELGCLPFFWVVPTADNWDKLFCKIEDVFEQRETWNCKSLTRYLLGFDSKYSKLDNNELEKKSDLIIGQIVRALHEKTTICLAANPLLKPYLVTMCKVGLKIIRGKITGVGFQTLSEENEEKGMDAIYGFLKEIKEEKLLFE